MRAIGLLMGCLLLLAAMQSSYVVVQARSGSSGQHHGEHKTKKYSNAELHSNKSQHKHIKAGKQHGNMDIYHDFQTTDSPGITHRLKSPDSEYMSSTQKGKQQHRDPFQVHISIERVHPHKEKPSSKKAHQQEIHKETLRDRKKGGHHQQCVEDSDCPQGECCLQMWTGEKVCKRGSYKTVNHHCINACICSPGLECVHHRHNRPRETDRRHTLGRCQQKTHHHHHHKQPSETPSR